MNLFFTSDHHFGHKNIIKYAKRPFDFDHEGMMDCARFMYEMYQQMVTPEDVVVFLGDLALIRSNTRDIFRDMFKSLKGTKLLVLGNHDQQSKQYYLDCGFKDIRDFHIVGKHFVCHYPCTTTGTPKERLCKNAFDNSECSEIWHGHIHEKHSPTFDGVRRHNMCVDYAPNGFKPIMINVPELQEYFEKFKRLV